MTTSTLFKNVSILGLLITALVAGDALARGKGGDNSGGGHSGHSGNSSWSGGGGSSHGQSFSRGGGGGSSRGQSFSSGGGSSSQRSFSSGNSFGRSSSGNRQSSGSSVHSSGQGPSFQGFPSSRSFQSGSGRSGGQPASPSFGAPTRSDSGGSRQADWSAITRRWDPDSGSRGITAGQKVQQAGAFPSIGQPKSRDFSRGPSGDRTFAADGAPSPSGDQVRSFLNLSDSAHAGANGNRVEANYPGGNSNRGSGNSGGPGAGAQPGGGNRAIGTRGPGSSQQVLGTQGPGSSQGTIGTQGPGSSQRTIGTRGPGSSQQAVGTRSNNADDRNTQSNRSDGKEPRQGGGWSGAGGNSGSGGHQGGGPGGPPNMFGNKGGSWSGHGGDVAHHGWSRRTNAADFQRAADSVRRQWHDKWTDRDFDHGNGHGDGHGGRPFYGDWWTHHYRPSHHRAVFYWDLYPHVHPYFWWTWAPAPRISAWFSFGWPRPYYWDYGPGEYIYCYNDVIYVNGVWYMPAREYYERTYVLAQRVPEIAPEEAAKIEWLPFGVFALTPEGAAQSDLLLQLAVTKDGVLGGTLFNQATGESLPVEGVVENPTQRAVWSYENAQGKRIVMETGVYNLTKPDTTALVHFGPDDMQIWQMVHLDQPDSSQPAALPAGPDTPAQPGSLPQPELPAPK